MFELAPSVKSLMMLPTMCSGAGPIGQPLLEAVMSSLRSSFQNERNSDRCIELLGMLILSYSSFYFIFFYFHFYFHFDIFNTYYIFM